MQIRFHTGAKLTAVGLMLIAVMFCSNIRQLTLGALGLLILAQFSGVFLPILKRLLPFLYLVLVMLLIHGLVNPQNQTYVWYFGVEGLLYGSHIGLRLICIVLLLNLLLLSTTTYELMQHIGRIHPDLGIMLGLLLSVLPVMRNQLHTTLDVQAARGLNQGTGMGGRLRAYIIVIVPVIIQSINRAHYMALLLYLRGYSGQKIKITERWRRRDWMLTAASLFLLLLVIYLHFSSSVRM